MEHKEYRRIVDGASTAVLFIHGIVGTPRQFDALLPFVPREMSVVNILLDGHGGAARDFSRTSMRKWTEQVRCEVDALSASHEHVYIAAHSMGTLFAVEQAIRSTKVKGLFLLAVPIKVALKPRMVRNALKVGFGRIKPDDHAALAAKASCGVIPTKNPFVYLGWIPRYLELFAKIGDTRRILPQLTAPCVTIQSRRDEMVSARSINYLKAHSQMVVHTLEHSGHFHYSPEDLDILQTMFQKFINV